MAGQPAIGIPPYIQSNSSGDTFSNNTYDPETGTEMQAINRKQQIANLLVQQSLAPRQGQMVGNVYVPAGWGQGLAQLGQAVAGAYMTKRHDKARNELESQNQQNVANAMQAYQESQQGRPALTVPEGSQGPERPEMPATPESQRMGLVRLMTNQNPQVQRFAQYEAQRQAKAAEMKAQQEQALAVEAAKARSAAQLKGIPSADEQAKLAQQAQLHSLPTGTALAQIEAKKQELATVPAAVQAQIDSQQQMHAAPSGNTLAGIDAQAALKNADLQQRQAEMTQQQQKDAAVLAQQAELKKAELAQQEKLHAAPSGNALAQIDAQASIQNANLQQRQAELAHRQQQDLDQLELDRNKFTNQADFQKAQLAQQAKHQQEQLALQREVHQTPSGNTLANVDAQAQMKGQELQQRQAELAARQKQDMTELALKKGQYKDQADFNRAKLALEAKHQGEQNAIAQERNQIAKAFHTAQLAKQTESKAPSGYRQTADGNLEAIPGGPADVKAHAAQSKLDAGRQTVNDLVMGLRDHYDQLDEQGGITNPDKGAMTNLTAGIGSSGPGQAVGRLFGTQTQSIRNTIAQQRPLLLNAIKEATGMSAKQMDSNAEMKMYLAAATDPTLDVKANRAALDMLDKLYGLSGQTSAQPAQATAPQGPAVGTVKGGYRFKGGDPASPSSWEKQ